MQQENKLEKKYNKYLSIYRDPVEGSENRYEVTTEYRYVLRNTPHAFYFYSIRFHSPYLSYLSIYKHRTTFLFIYFLVGSSTEHHTIYLSHAKAIITCQSLSYLYKYRLFVLSSLACSLVSTRLT